MCTRGAAETLHGYRQARRLELNMAKSKLLVANLVLMSVNAVSS